MRGKVSSYTGAAAFAALSTVFHTRNAAHLPAVQGPEADRLTGAKRMFQPEPDVLAFCLAAELDVGGLTTLSNQRPVA